MKFRLLEMLDIPNDYFIYPFLINIKKRRKKMLKMITL